MVLYVLDGLNGIIGMIQTYMSAIFTVSFAGMGDFEIRLPCSPEMADLLKEGAYIVREVDISGTRYNNVMVVEKVEVNFDTDYGFILTVSGRSLKSLLSRRVIWDQITENNTLAAVVMQVLQNNVIAPTDSNRTIPNFYFATVLTDTPVIETQIFGRVISDWLEEVCTTYGYGWDVYISGGDYYCELLGSSNRSGVVFSPQFDNLYSMEYRLDTMGYANAALIGGEGEGAAQRTASIGTASGLDRVETYIDGSGVSSNGEIITEETYAALLEQYGQEQLAGVAVTETFEAEVDLFGMFKYGQDFRLGDIVHVDSGAGFKANSRLAEITFSVDEKGNETVATFTEWEVE